MTIFERATAWRFIKKSEHASPGKRCISSERKPKIRSGKSLQLPSPLNYKPSAMRRSLKQRSPDSTTCTSSSAPPPHLAPAATQPPLSGLVPSHQWHRRGRSMFRKGVSCEGVCGGRRKRVFLGRFTGGSFTRAPIGTAVAEHQPIGHLAIRNKLHDRDFGVLRTGFMTRWHHGLLGSSFPT